MRKRGKDRLAAAPPPPHRSKAGIAGRRTVVSAMDFLGKAAVDNLLH